MRLFTLTVVLVAAALVATDARQQPSFRAGVELVTIDVVATSADGMPVHGLTAADFALFEDGADQPIKTFEFINFSSTAPRPALPPGVFTNEVEPGGLFTVVVDEIGVQVDDVPAVRRITERFFKEALQPDDHVAIVRAGATSGFFLTTDRGMALDAVVQSTGRRERTLGITAPGAVDPSVAEIPAPTIETFGTGENSRNSFRVLFGVVDQLRHIRARRKAVLWISRGGDMPQGYIESVELGRPVGRDDDVFSRLIDTARAANVAIYTIDPRGLQTPAAEAGRDLEPFQTGTLRDVAALTGGRAVLGNHLNAGMAAIAAENRAYYLLGYEPTPGPRKARKLRVTTRAAGIKLLHRSVYLPGTEARPTGIELAASPLPVRDLEILLAPASVAIDRRKRGILLPFEIGTDLADRTEVEYTALALDAAGKVVSRTAGRGVASGGRVVGEARLGVESKAYHVRFVARAKAPVIEGLAFATVRVPAGKSKDAECGGFIFEQAVPRGVRDVAQSESLTISTLISAGKLGGALEFAMGRPGGIPQKTWPVALGTPLADGLWRVALNLKAPLPAGAIEVQLLHDGLLLNDNCLTQFTSR